jgi:hypothetical protein
MEAYQWFLFGMIVALTPSLVVLAVSLRKQNLPGVRDNSEPRPN